MVVWWLLIALPSLIIGALLALILAIANRWVARLREKYEVYTFIAFLGLGFVISALFLHGNLMISGEIARGKEFLGRHYGISELVRQNEDKGYVVKKDYDKQQKNNVLISNLCGYRLIVVTGIRYEDCDHSDIVAALIPTEGLPFWSIFAKMPPALVLHADLSVWEMSLKDVPLKLAFEEN